MNKIIKEMKSDTKYLLQPETHDSNFIINA